MFNVPQTQFEVVRIRRTCSPYPGSSLSLCLTIPFHENIVTYNTSSSGTQRPTGTLQAKSSHETAGLCMDFGQIPATEDSIRIATSLDNTTTPQILRGALLQFGRDDLLDFMKLYWPSTVSPDASFWAQE
ncbi:7053_t:CDS:2, partial [Acaulospora colombiana]